jgi:uncharacterized membrane protein
MEIGKLHLLVLHFPLALIIVAAFADAVSLWRRQGLFKDAGYFCIVVGAITAIPAVITGLILLPTLQLTGEMADLGEMHESLGLIATCLAVGAAGVRLYRRNRLGGLWAVAYAILIVASVALISLTGHYGGMLAFGKDYLSGLF